MKYNINLLLKKEPPFFEKVMYFFFNYLRYIVVVTQLVVIGVFFYRFKIDQSIIDLKESVEQKKEIVQVVLPLLGEAKALDRRTKEVKKIISEQKKMNSMMDYLLSNFPENLYLTNLEMTHDSMKITGFTNIARELQVFYLSLQNQNRFGQVALESIKKTELGYSFTLSLNKFRPN